MAPSTKPGLEPGFVSLGLSGSKVYPADLALMSNHGARHRVCDSKLWRELLEEMPRGIEVFKHLGPGCNQLFFALPQPDEAIPPLTSLRPVGIEHPVWIHP